MRPRCSAYCAVIALLWACGISSASPPKVIPQKPKSSPVSSFIYSPKEEASSMELLSCNFTSPKAYDPYLVLHKLYGPWFEPATPGAGSMLVLGQHNSGTSMLARLMMLMGAFQGNVKGLSTSLTNRLKYWEKIDVTHFHDMVLSWVTDPKFKPYHAQGVDMGQLTERNRDNLRCFVKKIIKDLDRHKPWVLKDPRMLLFADFWIKEIKDPVCVFIFREPISNAVSLTDNSKKSAAKGGFREMTPARWLKAWEEGMLNALAACEDHPTILLQLEDMRTDLVRFTYKLYAMLGQVGVYHLQMPPKKVLDAEFGSNLKPKHRSDSGSSSRGVTLSKNQTALYSALLMVANSANMGLTEDSRRAAAVLRMYDDTIVAWDDA